MAKRGYRCGVCADAVPLCTQVCELCARPVHFDPAHNCMYIKGELMHGKALYNSVHPIPDPVGKWAVDTPDGLYCYDCIAPDW